MKTMSIRLSVELAQELEMVAAVDGQPVSEVIRSAIAKHIARRKRDSAFQDGLKQRIENAVAMTDTEGGEVILTANCTYNHHPLCKGPVCDCKCHATPSNPLP